MSESQRGNAKHSSQLDDQSDSRLVELLGRPGPWTYAYVDGPGMLPQVEEEALRRSVRERLEEAGAPAEDASAIESAVESRNGLPESVGPGRADVRWPRRTRSRLRRGQNGTRAT